MKKYIVLLLITLGVAVGCKKIYYVNSAGGGNASDTTSVADKNEHLVAGKGTGIEFEVLSGNKFLPETTIARNDSVLYKSTNVTDRVKLPAGSYKVLCKNLYINSYSIKLVDVVKDSITQIKISVPY